MNIKTIANYGKIGLTALGIYAISDSAIKIEIENIKNNVIEKDITVEEYEKIKNNAQKHSNQFTAIPEMLEWKEALDSLNKKAEYEKSQINIDLPKNNK